MNFLLFGLEGHVVDPSCKGIRLTSQDDSAPPMTFLKSGEGEWRGGAANADTMDSGRLIGLIEDEFGKRYQGCQCYLEMETISYEIERGSVKVSRDKPSPMEFPGAQGETSWGELTAALGIPKSKRQHKLKQAQHLAKIIVAALPPQQRGQKVRLLDVACGRSYLGFALAYALEQAGQACEIHGIEGNPTLVQKCAEIAAGLGWNHCSFEQADLRGYQIRSENFDGIVALHACDTLTDHAIRVGVEAKTPFLFLVPCCQREMRNSFGQHPLDWVSRYGLLEEDLADVLTDAFRCLVLEALGYEIKVLHFVASENTPKNILIRAHLTREPQPDLLLKAKSFLHQFGVNPEAARLLEIASLQKIQGKP